MGVVGVIDREYKGSKIEEEIFNWWKENRIYYLVKDRLKDKPKLYFLDGPPYVTNPIHVGTAWNKILKDAFLRYFRMLGYNVRDQPGYDMHGLPIEVMVERELGLKVKKDIEKFGVDRFVEACKTYALRNLKIMEEQFKNLGVWMDWDNPYMTIESNYIQAAWWLIKRAYERGLLSEGQMVFHWCPRCETVLSGYEVTDEYREVVHPSVYVKFPVEGLRDEYVIIWTTTPWTLPANIAIMVHPKENYVKVKVGNEKYILAEARCEAVFKEIGLKYEILERFLGSSLEGLKYIPVLLDEVTIQRKFRGVHKIVLSEEFVSMEEGTGCVHSAPGHGEEDFIIGLRYNLPVLCPVDDRGVFTTDAGKYAGKCIWDANSEIIEDLKRKGLLLYLSTIEHRYPHCWRCKSPLFLKATTQWFIKVPEIRNELIAENERVEWIPEWAGKSRFRNWLENVREWVTSRQRYWGIPMPIWKCSNCGRIVIVESLEELKSLVISSIEILDLHRPWIDSVLLKCDNCDGVMKRIPDVLDVWMDSSVAPWASLNFPISDKEFKEWWPPYFILEGPDQTRGWFYTLLVSGYIGFKMAPYKRVLMHGWSLDEFGRPMHKSLGNVIAPEEVFNKFSRDSLRLYELQCTPWEDLKFSMKELEEVYRVLSIMWNVYYFSSLYMNLDFYSPNQYPLNSLLDYLQPEDKWLLSTFELMVKKCNLSMERFHIHELARATRSFIVDDMSRWYIRLIRKRIWIESEDKSKYAVYAVLYHTLLRLLKLLAPIVPFITEKLYQSIFRVVDPELPISIHMCDWPKPINEFINESLIKYMNIARDIVETSYRIRQEKRLKLRYPLREMIISTDNPDVTKSIEIYKHVLMDQSNVKDIKIVSSTEALKYKVCELFVNYSSLGPKYKGLTPKIISLLGSIDPKLLKLEIESKGFVKLNVNGIEIQLESEDLKFDERAIEGYGYHRFRYGEVFLNCIVDRDLMAEGLARDVVRRLQSMRKDLNLPVDAYVDTYICVEDSEIIDLLTKMSWYIVREVRVNNLIIDSVKPVGDYYEKEWEIGDQVFRMGVRWVK
ncbi:MAG: isoleucine--tRNA ligase [Candidatus Methanomethylicia archaeon]|nr:isoleucine--tRNA ligase [Candidatus Methanomethylicia archaeon]